MQLTLEDPFNYLETINFQVNYPNVDYGFYKGIKEFYTDEDICYILDNLIFIVNGSLIAVFAESAVSVVKVLRVYTILLRNKFALRFYKFTQAGIRIICFCWQIANTGFEQLIF